MPAGQPGAVVEFDFLELRSVAAEFAAPHEKLQMLIESLSVMVGTAPVEGSVTPSLPSDHPPG